MRCVFFMSFFFFDGLFGGKRGAVLAFAPKTKVWGKGLMPDFFFFLKKKNKKSSTTVFLEA